MNKMLILLRGVSGAGKSTYAQRIRAKLKGLCGLTCIVCSADDYFMKTGEYKYDRSKIGKAHEECKRQARQAMNHDIPFVLVDNTNIVRAEFTDYIELAKEFGYITIEKIFGLDLNITELYARGRHGVPIDKVKITAQKLADSVRNVEGQTIHKVNGILTVRIKS